MSTRAIEPVTEHATVSIHIVSLPWRHAWQGLTMIAKDRRRLIRLDGVRFAVNGRTCGGGSVRDINMSLTLRREVLIVDWESPAAMTAGHRHLQDVWNRSSAEVWSATLIPLRAKGTWNGAPAFPAARGDTDGFGHEHVASLTYGKVRARSMIDFYIRSFPKTARRAVAGESRMIAGIGFAGERAIRQPCTFSVWPADVDVSRFAYSSTSPHGDVQRSAVENGWFAESAFVRFAVISHSGSWGGRDPLE